MFEISTWQVIIVVIQIKFEIDGTMVTIYFQKLSVHIYLKNLIIYKYNKFSNDLLMH